VGTSGGNTDDMRAAVALMQEKKVQTAKVVTHILGLNAAGETTLDLPAVGGGKKLVYTGKTFRLRRWETLATPAGGDYGTSPRDLVKRGGRVSAGPRGGYYS
jgi:hypothetical protein